MGFRERRLLKERCFMGGDGALEITGLGEFHPSPDVRPRIGAQCGNCGKDRIVQRRPARSELPVPLERPLRLVAASERTI